MRPFEPAFPLEQLDGKALPAVEPRVAREAAQRLMQLHSGDATPADWQALERWRTEDPAHEAAWQRAERVNQKLGLIPRRLGAPVLRQASQQASSADRRAMVKTLSLLIVAAPSAWVAYRHAPWQAWAADERTATGEQRTIALPDGSELTLNTASAIDVVFDAALRRVVLRTGEILVQTARDPALAATGAARPFIVQSSEGHMRAIGTRFIVRQQKGQSRVAVLEGAVELRPKLAPEEAVIMAAGHQTRLTATAIGPLQTLDPQAGIWAQGTLYADRMPLGDFCAELSRYRPGLLRCDPAVTHLHVSGAFQLRNTDDILDMLQETLPVRVAARTRYWVTLVAR